MAGASAVAVGLPVLQAMLNENGTALAQGEPLPRRTGIFFWGNGVRLAQWTPNTTGAGWTPSPALEPLSALKDYINVVSGMNIKTGNERGHHAGCVGILSGAPMIPQPNPNSNFVSTFSAPSIDQVVAAEIGAQTRFKSLEVGISRRIVKSEGTTLWYLSHNGPDNANPPEYDPKLMYNRLFGSGFMPPNAIELADHTLGLRRSILDAVGQDINDLKARVGTVDRQRLDQHFENIRALENRIELIQSKPPVGAACALPPMGAQIEDDGGREQIEARMRVMSELVAMSLACDLTRVFSIMFSGSVGGTVFWQVDVDQGHHQLTHDEPGDQPQVHATTVYTMRQFAILLEALKALPEGDGNLLDNTAILASSDVAEGLAHSIDDYPILIAGRGGGYFKYPGIHYRSDGENTTQVLLSMLHAAGLERNDFGLEGGHVTQTCSAIEA
jgi:hypothetical protein